MLTKLLRVLGPSGFDFEDVAIFTNIMSNALIKIIREESRAEAWEAESIAEALGVKPEEIFPHYTPDEDDD